jgi:predicted aspartyl protease
VALTALTVEVANLAHAEVREPVEFLLDSGTTYSLVPRDVLARLGIAPRSRQRFMLPDGSAIERDRSDCFYFYDGQEGAAPVIFAEPGDATVLGTITLASLGLVFDPIRRELMPLPMIVAGARQRRKQLLDLRGNAAWEGDIDRLRARVGVESPSPNN